MICIKCGAQNEPGTNFCSQCNANLPKMNQVETYTPAPKINERYLQLKEAGDKVQNGEWSVEEYAAFIDKITVVLQEKETQIREIEIPPEAADDFREELEIGFSGIDLYNEGLTEMRRFCEDHEASHIEAGLVFIAEGNDHINNAMRINRENRRKLEEMYIDTSTML